MVFVEGAGEFGQDYFEDLVSGIEQRDDWTLKEDQWPSRSEAVELAADGDIAHFEFTHNDTGAVLNTEMPTESFDSALYGVLRQSLLPEPHANRKPDPGSFHSELEAAYKQIAENHTAEYVSVFDTDHLDYNVLSLCVPWDYDVSGLESGLDELSEAATEVYELNESIRQPLTRYLER
jgi:hypothetical protein